jgi:hypothetical protein
MGRTLPSITQAFLNEQQSLTRFRRALRLEDQRALDDLLGSSRRHLAAAAYASHLLPFEIMLLSMLVEEHKQVLHLRQEVDVLKARVESMHKEAIPAGENRVDSSLVGAIHEFSLQDQDDDKPVAGDIDEPPLRKNDRDLDPGGHV